MKNLLCLLLLIGCASSAPTEQLKYQSKHLESDSLVIPSPGMHSGSIEIQITKPGDFAFSIDESSPDCLNGLRYINPFVIIDSRRIIIKDCLTNTVVFDGVYLLPDPHMPNFPF